MKKTILLLFTIVALTGCSKDDNSEVNIRLSNASEFDFENITLRISTKTVEFESLQSGQKTAYHTFEKAYRYAFVELEIDGETYAIQPIDFVGESLLKSGNYTYELDVDDYQNQYEILTLTLVED